MEKISAIVSSRNEQTVKDVITDEENGLSGNFQMKK